MIDESVKVRLFYMHLEDELLTLIRVYLHVSFASIYCMYKCSYLLVYHVFIIYVSDCLCVITHFNYSLCSVLPNMNRA